MWKIFWLLCGLSFFAHFNVVKDTKIDFSPFYKCMAYNVLNNIKLNYSSFLSSLH